MVTLLFLAFPVLPVLWISLVLLLLALGILIFLLLRQAKKASGRAKDEEQPDATAEFASQHEIGVTHSELPAVFSSAMGALRTRIPGRDFRYRLPWFLLLGRSEAGKSALLSESGLASALEEQVEIQQGHGISWSFFANGVVIEVEGWCMSSHPDVASSWRRLLGLFVDHRPERALDGLIVTLPVTDFVGPAALSAADLIAQAAILHQRLRQITQKTGFRLPIYCVLTKCDAIEGFNEFAGELENEKLEQILGWSNPHGRDAEFDSEWVDEALNSMRVTLERAQSRLFAVHNYSEKRNAMFLFPGNLYALIPGLRLFLSRVLKGNGDVPAPLFRGIYCCGSVRGASWEEAQETKLVPVSAPLTSIAASAPSLLKDFSTPFSAFSSPWIPSVPAGWFRSGLQIAFVTDLFVKKIFVEKGLASPLSQHFVVRDRIRLALQIACVVVAAVLATGTALACRRIGRERSQLLPLLSRIADDLQSLEFAGSTQQPAKDYVGTSDLINAMASFNTNGFSSSFIPASWFTSIDSSIEDSMVPAFRILVLERFYTQLQNRANLIADPNQSPLPALQLVSDGKSGNLNLDLHTVPEYQQMGAFVSQVNDLQRHVDTYNQMSGHGSTTSLQSIIDLDTYLNDRSTSISPSEAANPYFQQAVRDAIWKHFVLSADIRNKIALKTQQLTTALYSVWIENNPTRTATTRLVSDLNTISSPGARYKDLVAAQQNFKAAQAAYASPALHWIAASQFAMPADLTAVTTGPVGGSQFFEPWLRDWMMDVANQDFNDLVDALNGASTSLTGDLLDADDGTLALSDKALDVQVALDNLLNLPFVSGTAEPGRIVTPTSAQTVSWNTGALDATATLPLTYNRYLSEDLDQAPVALRQTFSQIASQHLSLAAEAAIGGAEQLEPGPATDAEPALFQNIQSFSAAAASLTGLLGKLQASNLDAPASSLQLATTAQAGNLLISLNRSFDIEQPYGLSTSLFDRWTGALPATAQLFDAPTADALAAYLAAQREAVRNYSNAAATLTQFLQPYRNSLAPAAAHALARWEAIGAAFQSYDAKHPGNSIQSLEDYIAADLNKVQPARSCVDPGASAPALSKPDYFTGLRTQLGQDLHLRCETLLSENVTSTYAALQNLFNRDLAGRFPFAPTSSSTVLEADPKAIGSLYRQYDTALDLLNAGIQPSDANQPVTSFLSQLGVGSSWFSSLLSTATTGETVSLDFVPQFRVNQAEEIGGDQIIAWTMRVGSNTFHQSDAERKGQWSYGDPVVLTLRWAKNSPFVPAPLAGATNSAERIDGDTVSYTFKDPWSLLRFVAFYDVPATSAGTTAFTLKFTIPETPSSPASAKIQPTQTTEAQVFMRLLISPAGSTQTISQAVLPVKAPLLPLPHTSTGGSQ